MSRNARSQWKRINRRSKKHLDRDTAMQEAWRQLLEETCENETQAAIFSSTFPSTLFPPKDMQVPDGTLLTELTIVPVAIIESTE